MAYYAGWELAGSAWKIEQIYMDAGPYTRFDTGVPIQKPSSSTMTIEILGRVLFPRLQPWQQRRQAKTVVTVLIVAVVFAAIVGAIIFWTNRSR
jgi:hypothetical protein